MIPIVLVHQGDSFYLKHTIQKIKETNPATPLVLLSVDGKEEFEGVTKLNANKLDNYSKRLEEIYVHKNTSNPNIELFCIKRWLILLDFMENNHIDRVFTMDSDVLLFTDIQDDAKRFEKFDFMLAKQASAGLTFINQKALRAYKDTVIRYYASDIKKGIELESNNTITDMSFWKLLTHTSLVCGEITDIIDGATYDAGVLIPQNDMVMKNGMKNILFENKQPVCRTPLGVIKLKNIHCQAGTKFYMKGFSKGKKGLEFKAKLLIWGRDTFSPLVGSRIRNIVKFVFRKAGV